MVLGLVPDTLGAALLASTILAGLRRSTGQTVRASAVGNPIGVQLIGLWLGLGEWTLDRLAGYARGSRFFHYDANVPVEWVKKQPGEALRNVEAELSSLIGGVRRSAQQD